MAKFRCGKCGKKVLTTAVRVAPSGPKKRLCRPCYGEFKAMLENVRRLTEGLPAAGK